MASPLLDFKKFKHIKSDDKSTTLQHKDGHMLTLAHNVLSPENQAQLKALSKVGPEDATQNQKSEFGKVIMKAKGGMSHYDDGGKVAMPSQSSAPKKPAPIDPGANIGGANSVSDALSRLAHPWAEGGKVPIPASPSDSSTDKQMVGRQLGESVRTETPGSEASKAANYVKKPSSLIDTLKNAWAEGGEVNPKLEQSKKTPETCHACGGPVHMYAEGTKHKPIEDTERPPSSKEDRDIGKEIDNNENFGAKLAGQIPSQQPPVPQQLMGSQQPQYTPPDPEQQIVGPAVQEVKQGVANWMMTPSGAPSPEVTPQDIAATKADAMVNKLDDQKQVAESVSQAAEQNAANTTQPQADNSPESLAAKGLAAETAGAAGTGKALGALGEAQATQLATDAARKQDIAKQYQENFQKLDGERQAHIADIQNGYIDPNQYWTGDKNGNGSHSKIAAGIGMIIAGFNPTNKPNAAIDFLNHQMDMNLDAQKQNLNAKNNLLMANLHQFKNLQDATDMTRIMQADVIKSQLQAAAAKAQTPMAAAAAQSAIGQIDAKYQPLFMQLQIRHMMQGLGSGGTTVPGSTGQMLAGLDVVAPEQARNYRERYYQPFDMPGGKSIADRPIPQDVRQQINAQEILDQKGKDVLNFVHQHTGTWNPQTRAVATQKIDEMKNFYNSSIQGGALTEGRLNWYDEQFKKHPTDILSQLMGSTARLNEMVQSNEVRKNETLGSYGLRPPQARQQAQPEIKTMGGIKYQKVPGGWKKAQ